ncbi:dTDP-glucose 4,6-dehydratase [Altericroceibacterium endophyticum]|uniref:dTDP-glucose 4,6-dehydratase n=1 Tax=Altericroceibacterium endophyticum TaxID=1808508 RepID=A0A6I4T1D1_9SPHN|nr:dTDP-glucose 4,6-dehydratase [Altericroceibacterium endophyticum]MXO64152.1 dTDP-glucose 4,6-dehydratase [Altericroceibacterium endophyticum]
MAAILITGGAGFIGSNFVRYWRKKAPNDAIIVLDALTYAGNPANLFEVPGVTLVKGDIRDTQMVTGLLSAHGADRIVHFAAETHVDRSISGPDAFISTNIDGTHSLLKAARSVWLDQNSGRPHRFHHVSTDEVYGALEYEDPAFREDHPYQPNSPYAASKAASDHLVRAYNRTYGLQTTISNCSNNYGPFQYPEKLIPFFILNALHGQPLPIYGDGLQIRDWLHVDDHCHGIGCILDHGEIGECYNIGGGEELPNLTVINAICSVIDAAFAADPDLARRFPDAPSAQGRLTADLKNYVTDRPGHDRRYAIDDSKIRKALGYHPGHDFTAGFTQCLRWYLDNEAWWRPLWTPAEPELR